MTMTKTIGNTKFKHISLLILKISLLTLFGCGVKIHKINPIFGYRVKITPDINPIYGLIELSWWLQKGKTIVCTAGDGITGGNHLHELDPDFLDFFLQNSQLSNENLLKRWVI